MVGMPSPRTEGTQESRRVGWRLERTACQIMGKRTRSEQRQASVLPIHR